MAKKHFNIIIMHGSANDYKVIKEWIIEFGYNPIVLKEQFDGDLLLNKVRNTVWDKAHCAVIVMTPDDVMNKTHERRARQNVIFELGYCMGAFDSIPEKYWYNSVIILKEKSVANFSDIHGLEVIEYEDKPGEELHDILKTVLKTTYREAARYYEEL